MFDAVTQKDLRAQMEQHLLMVEEVLGGWTSLYRGWNGVSPALRRVWAWSRRAYLPRAGWPTCSA